MGSCRQGRELQGLSRSAPCDTVPTELVAMNLTGTSYTDLPLADGTYCYGVTTDRRGAESAMSIVVQALSDRLAPDVPEGAAVNLGAAGVRITWGFTFVR